MSIEARSFEHKPYFAEKAYDLRAFAKIKRYTLAQITAHEIDENHIDRLEVEAFIYEVFYHAYGAKVKNFMPKLIALKDNEGMLVAAYGMRKASISRLFLEQYIEEPIEILIAKKFNKSIHREDITEIGNLAVINPRNAGILISHIIEHSIQSGVQWCVATAHHSLQNGLIKGGCDVYPLHGVDSQCLSANDQADWGSYYNNQPQIVAVRNMVN